LVFGRRDEGTRARGVVDFLAETIRVAQQFNIPHEILDTAALRAMFPQLTILDGDEGYFEPSAGFLFPDRCISRQLELARALGAETLVDTKVIAIERDDGSLSILSDKGRIAAARVVLTVGAWVNELLPEPLPVNFEIYPQQLVWFELMADPTLFSPERFPVFIRTGQPTLPGFYGFPALHGKAGGLKLASEQYDVRCEPDAAVHHGSDADAERVYRAASPFLPISRKLIRRKSCPYTVTSDSNFVIDFLPGMPEVLLASPCSGHGFKHSAGVGELLAELVLDGRSHLGGSEFRLNRFCN
ncbi:MAG: FAD-dependent oxidoreductase, partial [Bdellovibrionales bacterium]|nr:FAD-dependent oxidoreductase [Bdellovibrionales bacterium]